MDEALAGGVLAGQETGHGRNGRFKVKEFPRTCAQARVHGNCVGSILPFLPFT
jgi:hypothetical protein